MNPLLILLSAFSFAFNASVTRAFQVKYPGRRRALRIYQALFCLVAAIAFFILQMVQKGSFIPTLPDLINGFLFGAFYFGAVLFLAIGYEIGSMSLTSIILNMSLFMPLIYSCFLGDSLTVPGIIGTALIVVTMILAVDTSGDDKKASLRWFCIALLAFITNGFTTIVQKYHVIENGDENNMIFMTVACLCSAILFFISALFAKDADGNKKVGAFAVLGMATVSGLGSFAGNALMTYLCDKVSGAILYPFVNGGICIIIALASFIIFREKLTLRKLCAIAIGVSAIVLMCL